MKTYQCTYPGCRKTIEISENTTPSCQHGKALVTMRIIKDLPSSWYALKDKKNYSANSYSE